ncbi:MAG TPA: hypothetical protein VFA11_05115 [Acidimicrobiales bacterium]|nr:hypothetical protein [Acidimicrobiales bacterium]
MSFGAGEFVFQPWALVLAVFVCAVDSVLEEVEVAVEAEQRVDDRGFEVIGGYTMSGAATCAADLAGAASVVAIGAAASMGADANVGAFASQTANEAGQQIFGGCRCQCRRFRSALVEDLLGGIEGGVVEDRFVLPFVDRLVVADLSDVDRVAEQAEHGLVRPQTAAPGPSACVVEPVGERGRNRGDELVPERFDEVVAHAGEPASGRPDPGCVCPHCIEMLAGLAVDITAHGHKVEEGLGRLELRQVGLVRIGNVVAVEDFSARRVSIDPKVPAAD